MTIEEKKIEAIKYYTEVPVFKYTAMHIGIGRQTLYDWMTEDPTFRTKLEQARAKFVSNNIKKVRGEFKLERIEKEVFTERKEIEDKTNPIRELIEAYRIKEEIEGKDDPPKALKE